MATNRESVRLHKVLPRIEAPIIRGLTSAQARERADNGYANVKPNSAERTVGQIFRDNLFTYLNLVFVALALLTIFFGTPGNLIFLPVITLNTIIGIIQEIRSKRVLDKLQFITAPNAVVIRDGEQITIPVDQAVLDDIAVFSGDQQIYADAIVLAGECNVNEALVTGESDEIVKKPGDTLLSGSFVVTGECIARLDKVGSDSFVARLTLEAKKAKSGATVGMVPLLKRYVQIVGLIIIPVGIAMFIRQLLNRLANPEIIDDVEAVVDLVTNSTSEAIREAVDATVGALVSMVPDGLYLLVSVTLTISVMRLAGKRTLVQDRDCVETLARVNVLCVDKTGTITESNMVMQEIVPLINDTDSNDKIRALLADYVGNLPGENATSAAIGAYINAEPRRKALRSMPFSSAKKYGAVTFSSGESYILGAPERILQSRYPKYRKIIEDYSGQGYRIVLLAGYSKQIDEQLDVAALTPLALLLLSNKIRKEAPATFSYFARQGVKIIVISGDNPVTVSKIAREAGIEGAERYIDASELTTDKKLKRAVEEYIVFGRVTPDQKRKLVRALKAAGNTVAMTGDGVNDVLALKDANCSIAMASGSEVASQVSDIVLLDSDFSAMPSVVMEGRRVINNIERSASLYFTRNIFSFLFVMLVTIPAGQMFPLETRQLTLYSSLMIGIPSFILALEPNKSLVRGSFMANVFRNALPTGLSVFIAFSGISYFSPMFGVPNGDSQMVSLFCLTYIGFLMLLKLCTPFNILRKAMVITLSVAFVIGYFIFVNLGFLSYLTVTASIWLTLGVCVAITPVYYALVWIIDRRRKWK